LSADKFSARTPEARSALMITAPICYDKPVAHDARPTTTAYPEQESMWWLRFSSAMPEKDYDVAKWSIQSKPLGALQIDDYWIYGIAHVDATASFNATKTWLLHREPSGAWLIMRQMWNLK
jgi:hypothetical protein